MGNPHESRSSARVSDEELEYYGDLYIRCGIRKAGLDFESFLNNPEYYLQKHARGRWQAEGGDGGDGRKWLRRYLGSRPATRRPSD